MRVFQGTIRRPRAAGENDTFGNKISGLKVNKGSIRGIIKVL